MKTIIITAIVLFAGFGCGTKKMSENGEGQNLEVKTEELKATLGEIPENSDPVKIKSATISGNIMTLEVTYSGGCKDHEFQLIGREMISKSLPPIRSVKLVHTGNEDMCDALIMKTLKFDIRELAYKKEAGSEIMLKLSDLDESLKYTFE